MTRLPVRPPGPGPARPGALNTGRVTVANGRLPVFVFLVLREAGKHNEFRYIVPAVIYNGIYTRTSCISDLMRSFCAITSSRSNRNVLSMSTRRSTWMVRCV